MPAFATIDDVQSYWRPLSDSEEVRVTVLLDQVSALIRHHIPTIDTRIADAKIDPILVTGVAVRTVIERGPKGKRSAAFAIDWPG